MFKFDLSWVSSLILIVSSVILYLAYYLRTKYTHWEKRGIPYLKPALFFGNIKDLVLERATGGIVFQKLYNELDGEKVVGVYMLTTPALMVRDPELIKTMLIKNFSSFHDRFQLYIDENVDTLYSHLINASGDRWRNMRYKLTPVYSSGKLRQMEHLMKACTSELDKYLSGVPSEDSKTGHVLDIKDLMAKYAIDVIGSCAFGFQCNSIRDENSEFRRIGRLMTKLINRKRAWDLLQAFCPQLISILKLKAVHPEVEEFFTSVRKQSVIYRESSAQKKNDFLQHLLDIQAEEKAQLQTNGRQQNEMLFTDIAVTSNIFVFFVAGFETTAATLSFCLYELALNPEICEKMRDEVETVKRAHNNNLNYDSMKKLVYVDAVVSETLRKYPPGAALPRICTENFKVPGTSIVIERGTPIMIPVYGIHHDPKYYPEPEKFKPERFSEENKGSIVPGSYLPFGDGPRTCIAMRFVKFEIKSVLSYLVSNYTFHLCEKTVTPVEFDSRSISLAPLGGIWLRIDKIPKS